MKRFFALLLALLALVSCAGCSGTVSGDSRITLNVYNWGQYISDGSDGYLDVIAAFEDLDYREQTTIGMRLGFDAQTGFDPVPVCRYREIATAFELTCAATASNIFRRACRKMAASIMEAA